MRQCLLRLCCMTTEVRQPTTSDEMTFPSDTSGSGGKNFFAVQALGSSISYAKRYIMSAMLNITTRGEDDNGFAAVPNATVSFAQAAELNALLARCKPETQKGVSNIYGDLESQIRFQ